MYKITFKGPSKDQIQATLEKRILSHSEKLVYERLADIVDEVKAESGKFVVSSTEKGFAIKPEGFSPNLTAKILERFK